MSKPPSPPEDLPHAEAIIGAIKRAAVHGGSPPQRGSKKVQDDAANEAQLVETRKENAAFGKAMYEYDLETAGHRSKGVKDHLWHKKAWSWFLMTLMLIMISFQSLLLFRVGIGDWDFRDYPWLLPALLAQNFAQIAGLATFVVQSLFKGFGENQSR